jgi:hypothetical protein
MAIHTDLILAINAVIDARLVELGLMPDTAPVVEDEPAPAPAKPAKGKAAKAAKPAPVEPTHTLDELKTLLTGMMDTSGKQSVVDALARFGATRLKDVLPEQYDDMHAYLTEQMAADDTAPAADDTDDLFGA